MLYSNSYWGLDWNLKFAWLPHACILTGKIIWLKYGYYGTRLLTGPGEPIMLEFWHSKNEHLIWTLKHD